MVPPRPAASLKQPDTTDIVNVLYFADTRFPIERANGVQTMATCHALAGAGHDVHLVVRPDTAPVARDPFSFYGLAPVDRLNVVTIPASGPRLMKRLRFLWSAVRIARRRQDAVIFTRDLGLAALVARLPAARRPRLVYESHGIAPVVAEEMPRLLTTAARPSAAKLARLDRRERLVWTRAAAYVTITQTLADDLAARYGRRPHVFVVPDGAPARPMPTPSLETLSGREPLAGYAGHLYPWKGVDVFVRALAHAPRVHGLIVGGHPGEPDRARIESLARELGVEGRLEITGLVPPADVARHLERASMLVLPNIPSSISERYTSPLKLFEYLWCARPIVASDLPAIREVLTHDRTAWLVPASDVTALAAAMNRLADDRALALRLGEAARQLAPDFTWARRAARLEPALTAVRA